MDWKEEVIDGKINLMQLITSHSHIGLDGILQLQLPVELKNQNVTVIICLERPEWLFVLQKPAETIPDLGRTSYIQPMT
jgi:hypothetical protein